MELKVLGQILSVAFFELVECINQNQIFDENFYEIRFVLDDRGFALLGKCRGSVHV
jgi:hypothetical protein